MPDLLSPKNQKIAEAYHAPQPPVNRPKKKRSWLLWTSLITLCLVVILIGLGFLTKVVLAINSTNSTSGEKVSFFEQIKHLVINPERQIQSTEPDRINILLAGIGGPGHQGAYLADTIIVASIKPSTGDVALLSIPRDLYVNIPEYGWRKINNALAFGMESDYPGGGEALLQQVVEQVTGLDIPYYARIDFTGFREAINDVGGLDIYVDTAFADYEYPDYNYGYQFISFKQGWDHMNGERALQYVRSRHGTNGEGSDFARSKRQQKVLFTLKEKIFSINSFINPSGIVTALEHLGDHNRTNLEAWELIELAQLVKKTTSNSIITKVLDTTTDGLLVSDSTPDGAYILRPKSGTFDEIQYLAQNIFTSDTLTDEQARIEIQNSTGEPGLAAETAEQLERMKYNVVKVANTPTKEQLDTTTIYDLTGGRKPYTIVGLKNILGARVSSTLPAFMTDDEINYDSLSAPQQNSNIQTSTSDIDILIIIGTDLVAAKQLTHVSGPPYRHAYSTNQ